ncbi:hypothetical protein LTR70_006143 [Exophiala xenobiotica]|uniref:Uncharacterized protein n=1 Tax=Lithohypha guttulata TaxID=1690604 RepID=A0ABR0K8G6_9EURO|nr:hypothetical protein LTR24_005620 [Lithohypha guttulata]KAK5316896.1 hypothetical protein LTR70_006143 [Exophiala xenobiotica]
MAPPKKESSSASTEDKSLMLKEAFKCVNGNLDFDKLAGRMGVPNGEAMRKRFKRFFEKDDEPLQLMGSTLGTPAAGAAPVAKTPRTPKAKTSAAASGGNDDGSPKAKTSGKKRKVDNVSKDDSKVDAEASNKSGSTADADEEDSDTAELAEESPKKKAKATKSTAPRTTKSPKAPATPKTPKEPKTPKVSRTPKSTKSAKVNKTTQKSDAGGVKEEEPKMTENGRVGNPEIQAKTDGTIKETEGEYGIAVGEPEGQAVYDGFEKASASAEDD